MQVPVLDVSGKEIKKVDLPSDIFEVEINTGLMHQAYIRQMAGLRLGTHNTLNRGEVNLTKAKWFRQKGTGRARHGSQNSPTIVGGGVAHGPHPRSYKKDMPKKMRRAAIRSALSALLRDDQLVFVDQLRLESGKTKDMQTIVKALVGDGKALVLVAERNDNVQRTVANLTNAKTLRASYLNIRDLLQYDKVIVPLDALDVIKSIWGRGEK
jgi:large subunit ribosomal protein L4